MSLSNYTFLIVSYFLFSLSLSLSLSLALFLKFVPHCKHLLFFLPFYDRVLKATIYPWRKSLLPDLDRKYEKVRARRCSVQIRQRAYLHTRAPTYQNRMHAAACTRNYTWRRLPLTDPRIHEWSVGYQWAVRCYPHARGPLFLPPPPPPSPACMLALSRDRSRGYDMLRRLRRWRAYVRNYGGTTLFFPSFLRFFFFSHGWAIRRKEEKDRTPGYDLAAARPCVRAYVRALLHGHEGKRARCPGKDFLVRKSPRSFPLPNTK